ncbi:shikimate dehydrogenase family protein [Croceiramulus getboli]|nr:shikimate dehydrogenase [Flavobacteriaceae bacterium YJPT1-3]
MRKFGLIGKNIDYSFSRQYFRDKFEAENIAATYVNFDCAFAKAIAELFNTRTDVEGFNVTIPYKEQVIDLLDELDPTAAAIGAVNTIKRLPSGALVGYNTDHYGFRESLLPLLKDHHQDALILGTGGASKAVAYALDTLEINYQYVSRTQGADRLTYSDLNAALISDHPIIINTTPLGTHPNVEQAPELPYLFLGEAHLLYDLVYNPPLTRFLKQGQERGATIINGKRMLELQAERAWEIWTSQDQQ